MSGRRCVNCMRQIDDATNFCPRCGASQTDDPKYPYAMRSNSILHGKYLVGRVLGQGGFGITYVGFDLALEIKVAIKEYFPMGLATRSSQVSNIVQWNSSRFEDSQVNKGLEVFLKEARGMAKLDAVPGIVHVRETFADNGTAYIIMDFVEGENLRTKMAENGTMGFVFCANFLHPLMESISGMHRQNLIHRDISPDNIMVQPDGTLCLLDFGALKDLSNQNDQSTQMVMKQGFSPIEQCGSGGNIGPWTDVYAMTATIYYCLTGRLVPNALDRAYEDRPLDFTLPNGQVLQPAVQEFLNAGLAVRYENRIQTMDELAGRMMNTAAALGDIVDPAAAENKKKEQKKTKKEKQKATDPKKAKRRNTLYSVLLIIAIVAVRTIINEMTDTDSSSSSEETDTEDAEDTGDTGDASVDLTFSLADGTVVYLSSVEDETTGLFGTYETSGGDTWEFEGFELMITDADGTGTEYDLGWYETIPDLCEDELDEIVVRIYSDSSEEFYYLYNLTSDGETIGVALVYPDDTDEYLQLVETED